MINAEEVASTVLHLSRAMGSKGTFVSKTPSSSGLTEGPAFYTIWTMTTTDGEHGLPIYAGYTGRNLAERIKNHTNVAGSVLETLFAGHVMCGAFPIRSVGDQAWVEYLGASAPLAAAIEGIFLSNFDFALNTVNNPAVRALKPVLGEPCLNNLGKADNSHVDGELVSHFRQGWGGFLKEATELRLGLD